MKDYMLIINGLNFDNGFPLHDNRQFLIMKDTTIDEIKTQLSEQHEMLGGIQGKVQSDENRTLDIHYQQLTEQIGLFTATHTSQSEIADGIGLNTIYVVDTSLFDKIQPIIDYQMPGNNNPPININ